MAFLMSCGNEINNDKLILDLLNQKVNLQLKDSIINITTEDGGIDLHGSWSETYMATISNSDLDHIIDQIKSDTVHKWAQADNGDYVTSIHPNDFNDTMITIGIMRSKYIIYVNMTQGF